MAAGKRWLHGVFGQRVQWLHAMDGWGVHGCYVVRWRSGAAVMCGGDALPVEKKGGRSPGR